MVATYPDIYSCMRTQIRCGSEAINLVVLNGLYSCKYFVILCETKNVLALIRCDDPYPAHSHIPNPVKPDGLG